MSASLLNSARLNCPSSLLSVLCRVGNSYFIPNLTVCMEKMILKQYVIYYMDFLEEAYCCVFPRYFFFLSALFTGVTLYTRIHLCIPNVCV